MLSARMSCCSAVDDLIEVTRKTLNAKAYGHFLSSRARLQAVITRLCVTESVPVFLATLSVLDP